ncbi:uncharacterized protein N7515_002795 [Penicillium bovifimosum]|uniref:Allergen Asp f 7 n=1 Tax=Penicillium bovifimosum TaxID=126998 RepID=A0A9W9HEJ9_9EURO|nr:uncharacterized protein N7515_002795 [Penicillium bovifimosum]KAJ5144008.1 hypothetical protein N7515_002795 [Penicillium bovifimosum]
MAPITKTLALAGAFFALTGYSAPVAKRAVVWETVTDIVWTTVDVTTTVQPYQATTTAVPVVAAVTTTAAPAPTVPTVQAPAKEVVKAEPTTSSTTAAPAPTTPVVQAYSAPEPVVKEETTSAAPAPVPQATARAAAPAPAPASSGSGGACSEGSPCEGMITFYDTATTATNPSSCGNTNDGTVENVLALPHGIMQDSDCGKTVTIEYNGQTATGTVVDKCMGCDNTSIDLSRHLFGQLAAMDKGRVEGAKWYIN